MEGIADLDKGSVSDSISCPSPLPELEQDPSCQVLPSPAFLLLLCDDRWVALLLHWG